jgi:hypothetical protein
MTSMRKDISWIEPLQMPASHDKHTEIDQVNFFFYSIDRSANR